MSAASPPLPTCSTCQAVLDVHGVCRRCQDAANWKEQIDAVDFVTRRFGEWQKFLSGRQFDALSASYARRRQEMEAAAAGGLHFRRDAALPPAQECWSCREPLAPLDVHCPECGVPVADPGVRSLRYWRYLYGELKDLDESGRLTLRQSQEFLSDTKERIASLRGKLERMRTNVATPPPAGQASSAKRDVRGTVREMYSDQPLDIKLDNPSHGPRRNLLEILVDPQSIQWLLAGGGCLIFIGLAIWLSSLGLFKNTGVVAVLLGIGNAALVGGGWALILGTRFRNAGRALTLLACLLLPLNLWFYHTHGLVTLQGHLWLAALVCCVVYAASAYVLKDALFVYTLVGGLALTGLLFLAEQHHFGEVFTPAAFLIFLGLICLHAERAFPDDDSPFSRRRFGMAFYWSSQALIAPGLLLLLGAQLIGWLYAPIFKGLGMLEPPAVSTREYLPWTLLLVLAGTYAYIYSDVVVRRIGVYIYLAAFTLLWAEIQFLILTDLAQSQAVVIIALALTGLAVNILQVTQVSRRQFLHTVPPLGMLLSTMPVAYGVLLLFRATNTLYRDIWPFEITWTFVAGMAVAAVCCRVGAYLYRPPHPSPPPPGGREGWGLSVTYFFLTALATLVGAAGLASMLGWKLWVEQAPILMLIPIIYLLASRLYRGHTPETPLVWAAHAATAVMIGCSILSSLEMTLQRLAVVSGDRSNLLLALFCLETALFYALVSFERRTDWTIYLATVMLCGAVWQLLKFFDTPDEVYTLVFALTGFALLLASRFGLTEGWNLAGLEKAIFRSANALTTLGFAAGALLALSRLLLSEAELAAMDPADWRGPIRNMLYLLIVLAAISLLSALIVQQPDWRRVHLVISIVNAVLIVLLIHKLVKLDPWQKLEIFAIFLGMVLLAVGHVGWYRESERNSDLVSVALVIGSLCLLLPLFLASAIHRFSDVISRWDELGLVLGCIVLFGSGVVCRIKATTMFGAAVLIGYVLMVLVYLHRFLEESLIVGIYLTLGGVVLFGAGLVLSVYRDRLLSLPDRLKRREGIFRIIDWR